MNFNYSTAFQSSCSICNTPFPDFKNSENKVFHLNCLITYSKSDPNFFDISQYAYKDFLIPTFFCSICENKERLATCMDCLKIFCTACALNPAKPLCCQKYRQLCMNEYKKCAGCSYYKRVTDFCWQVKCEAHDYLCLKCWNLGSNVGKCVMGCVVDTKFSCYVQCRACGLWKPRYLGEYRCQNNCEICELCGYKRLINFQSSCLMCQTKIELTSIQQLD